MTIGITAFGRNAGLAVFRGLRAAEAIGSGCIGGFASFAVITSDGELLRASTQRGGTTTLFVEGDLVGADPPPEIASAPIAALMSSGPDRPEPLDQFVAGEASVGLVTGHRFAHRIGARGIPFNVDALLRIKDGMGVDSAVDAVIDENADADVGLVAVDVHGRMRARNTERVRRRPDQGGERRERQEPRAGVCVLHNAIHPSASIASLVGDVAMEVMLRSQTPDFWIVATAGTPVIVGEVNLVKVDSALRAIEVHTTDASLVRGRQDGAAIYIDSSVFGMDDCLGYTITEPYVVLDDGVIESLSGQSKLVIGCRRI